MKKLLNRILGFLPITKWEAAKIIANTNTVLEALQVSDSQHSQMEKTFIEQLTRLTDIVSKGTPKNTETSDNKTHPEFG